MATIQDVYKAACQEGFINPQEFTEQAFGDMLANDANRRAYYDHVRKIDPTFYSSDYDTFSKNALSIVSPNNSANTVVTETGQPADDKEKSKQSKSDKSYWQSIGTHNPYPLTKEDEQQLEKERQVEREKNATLPMSEEDKERQETIKQLQTEGLWGRANGYSYSIDKETGMPIISKTNGDGMHLSIGTPSNQDEIDRQKAQQSSYITREIKTPQDLYTSVSEAWIANTSEGQKAKAELDKQADSLRSTLTADLTNQVSELQRKVNAGELSVEDARKQADKLAADAQTIFENEIKEAQDVFFRQMTEANADYLNQQTRLLGQKATNQTISDINARIAPHIRQLETERQQAMQRASQSVQAQGGMYGAIGASMSSNTAYKPEKDQELALYHQSQQFLADAAKISDAAQKGEGFWKGLGKSLGDIDTWDFGISQLTRSANLKDIVEKYERGEQLTDAEKGLMDSAVAYMSACAYNSDKINRRYKMGQTTGESIPFMLQFMVMPIGAIKDKVAKGVLGYGIEQFGGKAAQAAGKVAAKYGAKTAFKEAGTALLSNLAAAGVQTAAFGVPKIAEGAISRMTGDIQPTITEQGNIAYNGRRNQQSAASAVWNSAVDMYAENLSEMILTSLDPLKAYAGTAKLFSGLKNSQIAQVLGRLNEGVIGKVRDRVQFRNYLEEVGEEYVGNLIRWGLSTDVNNAEDAGLSADRQIDTWLGLAPTSIAFGAANIVEGGIDRFQSSRAAKRLREIMADGDKRRYLESLLKSRNSDDFSKNAHEVIKSVLRDKELNEDTKRLIMDGIYYTYQSQLAQEAEQARVQAEAERQTQPEQQPEQSAQQEIGQQTASAAESEANQEGEEHYQDADGNEVTFYRNADGSVSLRDENDNAAVDEHGNAVVLTQAEFDKYTQDTNLRRVDRELSADQWAERENELRQQYASEIRPNTHNDGNVYEVALASDGNKHGYIVGDGNVEIDDTTDHAAPRITNSDVVTVRYEDGAMEQVAAKDLNLLSVGSANDIVEQRLQPFQQYEQAMQTFRAGQEVTMDDGSGKTYTSRVVSVSEDGVEVEIEDAFGNPTTWTFDNSTALTALHPVEQKQPEQQGEQVDITNPKPIGTNKFGNVYQWVTGKAKEAAQFLRQHKNSYLKGVFHRDDIGDIDLVWGNDKAGLQHIVKRHILEQTDFDSISEAIEAISKTIQNGRIVSENDSQCTIDDGTHRVAIAKDETGNWIITAYDNSRGKAEKQRGITNSPLVVPSTEQNNPSDVAFSHQENGDTSMSKLSTGKGTTNSANTQAPAPNINTMSSAEIGATTVEYMGGDRATAVAYLEAERDKADAEVKRLAKQKVTRYTDIADFKRQNDELQTAKKAAADRYNKLQNAIATANNYKTKVEQAAEAERKAREEERRATRRQTQTAQLANAAPAERWKAAPKVEGNAVTRTLSDGTVIKGHYILVEAGAATPSHDPFNGWNTSNGFPVTDDGKNINDRDYKNDTDAQQITTQIAQTYDGQAVAQVPVVSSEGIVYDGNGRTIAGNIAAANNTDGAYIQALADNAGNFGFAPEQVEGMQHPRVYMQTDEDLPYNTTTFAKFNAQEKKSQGSTNRAVSSSKKLTEAARDGMLRILDNYGTLDAFFASEAGAKDIVRSLLDNGIITQQEVAGLTENTDRGFVLSPAGKDYVTDLLIGGLFDEQTIRMLGNDKGLKQSILRAMPSIVENRRLGDYALTDNINNAIRLLYEARQAGMAYPLYVKQGNAFDGYVSDRFSPFEMLLAEEMSSGVETFRQVLNLYNNSARDEANGQTGLFEPRTFDDIKKEILQHYGKSTDQSAATAAESTQSRPANTQTEPPVPSTPTGDGQGEVANLPNASQIAEEVNQISNTRMSIDDSRVSNEQLAELQALYTAWSSGTEENQSENYTRLKDKVTELSNQQYYTMRGMDELTARIDEKLGGRADRKSGYAAVQHLLTRNPELGREFLRQNNINKVEELKEWCAKRQYKLRVGKGKEAREAAVQANVDAILGMAHRAAEESTQQEPQAAESAEQNQQSNSAKAPKDEQSKDNGDKEQSQSQQSENKIFTEDAYEAARRRMHERLNRLNAGLDPEMLSDGLIMAGYHVEKGARKFAEFAREMIREFGDKIRPYLKSFYNGLRDLPEAVDLSKEMDDYGIVAQFDVNSISIERAKETEKSSNTLLSAEKSVTLQPGRVDVEELFGALNTKGEAKLSDHIEQEFLSSANAEDTQPIGNVTQSKHTKTGEDIWIVKPSERVSEDEFKLLKARAKANNGYYSSFAKNRGFIFKSKEDANNFNNISNEEITTDQTSADTETAVRTAETVVGETANITRDRRDSNRAEGEPGTESIEGGVREPRNVELTPEQANEQVTTRQQAIAKIDNANDKITDQLAVLGFYEADTSDPTKLHESYGYIKTAEAKAVKDIDRLAKQLADDLGIKVSKRKTIAKANIAPAGGDISFRLPLENGKELYLWVDIEPNIGNYYRADGDANSLVADHIAWRIEDPQANGTSRYLTSNQNYGMFERGQVTTTYADLLRDIRRTGRNYLPTIPAGTTKQEIAKQIAEKTTRKKKDTTRIADTQSMLDLFGDVADTMNEGVQQEQDEPERKFVNAVSRHLLGALVSEDMQTPFRSILDLRKLAKESGIEVDDNGKTDILLQELVEDGLVRAARQLVASGKYGNAKSKATYDAIVHLYEIQPTIAQRSSNRIAMQQYSTPLPMAFVADMFAYEPNMRSILEPTAGNGMLVFAVPAEKVHANELDETRLANLHLQEFQEVTSQDATEPFGGGKRYDAIIANPPFGSREEREYDGKMIAGLDPQITLNALASMKDSGKAAIIIGGNMEYADNGSVKDKKAFWSYLYDHYNVKGVVDMDGQLYRKQGTTYPTRMILIDGRRSEAEREQTTVYPPIQQKAIAKVNTFDDLYNTIAEITNSNKKTNGTEILRTTGGSSSVSDSNNTSGNTGVLGHSGQHRSNDGDGRDGGQRPTDSAGSAGGNRPNAERGVSTTPRTGGGKVSGHPMGGVLRPQEPVHGLNTTSDDGSSARPERATTDGERSGEDNVGRPGRVPVDGIRELGTPGDRVGLKSQPKRNLTEEKLPYRSHNTAFSLQSVAPAAMVEAMDNTLSQIEKSVGKSIDQFVTDELGYDTIQDAHNALAAEQMDSVAMAIYQMKQGQSLIIGDQTGVGKGRQMAALIRWAVRQGKKPIFVTQKADLFSDIYRDLVDIGSGDLRPFILNSDGAMVDANGGIVHKPLPANIQVRVFENEKLLKDFDYVVLTYSQVNTGDAISQEQMMNGKKVRKSKAIKNNKPTPKATFLRNISKDNYLFLDESHTAAGDSNVGAFFQSIIGTKIDSGVRAVTFASATFAKRPDTMPMYALRTAMAEANIEREELIDIIEKGGVTLQEIMSRALTESGQMVRRERDMSDVRTDWKTIDDPTIVKQAREQYDRTIVAFNAIIDFQDKFITPLVKEQDRELAEVMSTANLKKGTKKFGVDNTPFASKTFNYTKQLMLALKVDAIVDEVEREIKAGRHPVIALESTMESTIKDYTPGETIAEPSFSASLLKGLDNCMQYTIKDDQGVETHMTYTPNELGEEGETAYYKLQDFIRESTKDIFISPLDAIIERLHEKGYRVGELTGRNTYVERTDDGKIIVRRRTDKDKKRMQREFNSGALDVLILNKSASTGISLHASEKFSDQRQRSMIIAQPLSDINDYMQMIGRIDRTGQVHRGYYINLGLPVPAESRFLMMLSTKLKSLNANTTTSQDSESNEVDAPDLLNKYGSQVVIEYLRDNPTIYEKIGEPLKKNSKKGDDKIIHANELDEYTPSEDDALKITGRVALLNTKEQEEFYNDVVRRYNDLIRYLNDTGTNDLKITTLPLRAKTISRKVSSVGREPNGNNPFAGNAYVEQVEMDVLSKPMKANEVQKLIVQLNGTSDRAAGRKRVKDIMSIVERETEDKMTLENERYENAKQKAALTLEEYARKINANEKMSSEQKATTIEQKQQETEQKLADKNRDNILSIQHKAAYLNRMLDMFTVGETYLVPDDLGSAMFSSSTHSIFCGYKVKDNKISASTSFAVFATLDGRRKVEIKLSDISILNRINDHTNQNWDAAQQTTLDNWDKQIPTQTRKEGYIMTGNILQAVADTQDEYGNYTGQLISYTDIDGNIHDGILMPDKWKASQLRGGVPISARLEQMKQGTVVSTDGKVTIRRGWGAPDVYFLIVPKSKSEGGKYFLNPDILRLVEGNNFYTVRGHMQAEVPAQNIEAVLGILSDMGVKAQDSTIEAQYDELDYDTDNLTDAQQLATDTVLSALNDAGISVERVSVEQAEREVEKEKSESSVRLIRQMAEGTKGQSNNPITSAKVQKNLEDAKEKYKKYGISTENAITDISKALGARNTGTSNYITIEAKNGTIFTLRLSNHNATVANFDNNGETSGISIVISRHDNKGITNNGDAHIVEFFYSDKSLNKADGTPIADIIGALEQTMYSGEYTDPTGLAQRQEVNIPAELQSAEFSIRQTPAPKNTGIGYKVFYRGKDGKLYPPMVANPNGADTPIGVWLNADAAPISGESKTGRPQVKAGGKGTQGGSGQLAYRPGWHLGEIPYALQFNRKDEKGDKTLFPKDFVWAEVEYAADVNYQQEAEKEGITENGKYRHSYAGLKHLPTDGYYRYRTNPNPETDPWIITGAMKVNRVLTNEEVDALVLQAGREPQQREFFRTSNGTIYGYAKDGKIYLTDKGFNPNTPIHEYAHLWVKAVRNNNAELYSNLRNLFSRENLPDMWNELDRDPQYSNLSDEAKLSEIIARFSGKRGAERMEQEAQKLIDDAKQEGKRAVADAVSFRERMRNLLRRFWNWVGEHLFHIKHFGSREEAADRVLYDLLNVTDLHQPPAEKDSQAEFSIQSAGESAEPTSRLTRSEVVTKILVQNAKNDYNTMQAALNKVSQDIKGIRAAMRLQSGYDRNVVSALLNLYNTLLQSNNVWAGYMPDTTQRVAAQIVNAIGKQDINKEVNTIMDYVVDAQAKAAQRQWDKLRQTPIDKINISGVVAQGKVALQGQYALKALNNALESKLTASQLEEMIGSAMANEENATDESLRTQYKGKWIGYSIAQQHMERIGHLKQERQQLLDELDAKRSDKSLKPAARQQVVDNIKEMLRDNNTEQTNAYIQSARDLQDYIAEQGKRAKGFIEKQNANREKIRGYAARDLAGVATNPNRLRTKRSMARSIWDAFASPIRDLQSMLRLCGMHAPDGEGYLYNHFMRNWMDGADRERQGIVEASQTLDNKIADLTHGKYKTWEEAARKINNASHNKFTVTMLNGVDKEGNPVNEDIPLSVGNALYIYAVNKMADGKMKLAAMNITDADVEKLTNDVREKFGQEIIDVVDWIQSEYFSQLRNRYNPIHEQLFGAPMDAIENYFPLRINPNARQTNEDVSDPDTDVSRLLAGTSTGAIKRRTRNTLPLDVRNADFFAEVVRHITQMERWSAFAPFTRDANILLSDINFRNRIKGMKGTIYGEGDALYNSIKDAFRVAVGTYRPKTDNFSGVLNLAKGNTAAKINFRLFTALKQLASFPAFFTYMTDNTFVKSYIRNWAMPRATMKWAMEMLPNFDKRIKKRDLGDMRLMQRSTDWQLTKRALEWSGKYGMAANVFFDTLTCATGARAVYDSHYKEYLGKGYSEQEAAQRARQDAEVAFNTSQQSTEGAFMAPVQVDRNLITAALTVFRTSSFQYTRNFFYHVRTLMNNLGSKQDKIDFRKQQYLADGLSEDQAQKAAHFDWSKANRSATIGVVVYGAVLNILWRIAGIFPYLLFGDDDDKKKELSMQAITGGAVVSPITGLLDGNVVEQAIDGYSNISEVFAPQVPFTQDVEKATQALKNDKYAEFASMALSVLMQSTTGFDPHTAADMITRIANTFDSERDIDAAKASLLVTMAVLSVPESQYEQILIDDVVNEKVDYSDALEDYVRYRSVHTAPLTWYMRSEEQGYKNEEAAAARFDKLLDEREQLKENR